MTLSRVIVFYLVGIATWSCNNDDNGGTPAPDPPRPLSEVLAENEAEIKAYLETHYYNYAEFQNPPEDFNYIIKISELQEGDTLETLSTQVESKTIRISSNDLGIEGDEQNIEHTMYYLNARPGVGENPTEVDSVFLRYEGTLLNGNVFDSNISNPTWLDLQGTLSQTNPGTIQGFKRGLPQFKSGGDIIVNDDGTFDVQGFSSGLLIFPSALGYYNSTNVGPAYSPIVFNLQVLVSNTADHDRDGKPTKDEVEIDEEGNVTLTDSNDDGVPDYLDPDTN